MKTFNVLADYHHQDLYHSFRLLFERRLKAKLYRPIGYDWADQGYWLYHAQQLPDIREGIKKQYLEIQPSDGKNTSDEDVWIRADLKHGEVDQMLTLDAFMKKPIDIVIASVANHEKSFAKLCKEHPNKPKLIRHAGNINEIIDYKICKNLMLSTGQLVFVPSPDANIVHYHQEFDLDVYKYAPPVADQPLRISNFMNCLPNSFDFPWYVKYQEVLNEFDWKMYGILGKDGNLTAAKAIASEMSKSTFIWHVKPGGDGFGHTIHNAFACGRPVITRAKHYQYSKGQLAGLLLQDKETCIDLDQGTMRENVALIRELSKPEKHKEMCEKVYARFAKVVDFDREEQEIREFLRRLK